MVPGPIITGYKMLVVVVYISVILYFSRGRCGGSLCSILEHEVFSRLQVVQGFFPWWAKALVICFKHYKTGPG